MTLDIRAGMFAVLRDGDVVGPLEKTDGYGLSFCWCTLGDKSPRWNDAGLDGFAPSNSFVNDKDIVATFATRAEALAYVADNPMNRELHPDGPDLASVPQTVAHLVPEHCTGIALAFEPGVLHINKDGSGYIAIDEKHFECEDDRGPDGGSVHWITRLDASEVVALRDFLTDGPDLAPAPAVVDWQARAEAAEAALQALADFSQKSGADFKKMHPKLNADLDAVPQDKWAEVLSEFADAILAAAKEPRHE